MRDDTSSIVSDSRAVVNPVRCLRTGATLGGVAANRGRSTRQSPAADAEFVLAPGWFEPSDSRRSAVFWREPDTERDLVLRALTAMSVEFCGDCRTLAFDKMVSLTASRGETLRPGVCCAGMGPDARATVSLACDRARTGSRGRGASRSKRATAKKHTISTLKTMLGPACRLISPCTRRIQGCKTRGRNRMYRRDSNRTLGFSSAISGRVGVGGEHCTAVSVIKGLALAVCMLA
jgi:hypothetical protein